MATDFVTGLITDVRAVMALAWPEVSTIWEAEHINQFAWPTLVDGLPYAVIHLQDLTATDQFGSTTDSFIATVDCYYVLQVNGPLTGIQKRLMALRQRLNNTATNWVQVQRTTNMSWDDALQANVVLTSKNSTVRAGRLRFTGEVQDTFFATDNE